MIPTQTAVTLLLLLTSWSSDVTQAKYLCDLSPAEEEELTSAAQRLNVTWVDHSGNGSLARSSMSWRRLSTGDARDADLNVCSQLYRGPAVNLRSSCPWHYQEVPTPRGSSPHTLLQAALTCGGACLMTTPDGRKVPSNYPCVPVTRSVSVLRCLDSGHGPDDGRRCCRTELRSVPVGFTCAFPAL